MTEQTELNKSIRKNAINSAIVLGATSFVLGVFSFYFITSMTTSIWMIIFGPLIFSVLIPILVSVFTTLDIRKKIGGFWSFKQATTGVFIMFIIASIISGVLSFGFRKLIEPDMVLKTQTAMVDATSAMLEKQGKDQETIDKQAESVKSKFKDQIDPTIGKTIQSFAVSIILFFVVALIYGAIFKKERPLFLDASDYEDPTV